MEWLMLALTWWLMSCLIGGLLMDVCCMCCVHEKEIVSLSLSLAAWREDCLLCLLMVDDLPELLIDCWWMFAACAVCTRKRACPSLSLSLLGERTACSICWWLMTFLNCCSIVDGCFAACAVCTRKRSSVDHSACRRESCLLGDDGDEWMKRKDLTLFLPICFHSAWLSLDTCRALPSLEPGLQSDWSVELVDPTQSTY